jgi:hypothetical protein
MIMRRTEESKAAAGSDPLADHRSGETAANIAFSSTALREPTLVAVNGRTNIVSRPFPSTAHREPILSLLASQSGR